MARWVETTQLPPRVVSEYDHYRHAWVVATTTTVLQTIHLARNVVDDPRQSIYTPLDPELPIPMGQPSPEEEEPEEVEVPSSPKVPYFTELSSTPNLGSSYSKEPYLHPTKESRRRDSST
ncbi:hypothetical protein PIB30_018979 [Stylosanthes scabra]|uniref:Uncharacterized protein n=1 Tax=Stylosanthes scabra TaxID=79078 RepID=A0ABU6Q990_9FABA|nr:hypothetical protein [Stylosanthes scabra]